MSESDFSAREAVASDLPILAEIAQAVQNKLILSGSLQQITGYSQQNMIARVIRGELYLLEIADGIIGSTFVERVTAERFPQIADWGVSPDDCAKWFLYGLMVDPAWQGRGWGHVLLNDICRYVSLSSPAILILDCWAGNQKLRRFYTDAGLSLHGVFPENDYQIAVFKRSF